MRHHLPAILMSEKVTGRRLAPQVTETKIRRLRLLEADTDTKIREDTATNHGAPKNLFVTLARDTDEGARACVARDASAHGEVLRWLANDPVEQVPGFFRWKSAFLHA